MQKNKNKEKLVSIVIPCYNEEKNIQRFDKEIYQKLHELNLNFEIICIDDGSNKDKTWFELKKLKKQYPKITKILRHSRNYGMTGAYQTGFDNAKGDYVVVYSSDIEIPAKYIQKVVKKLDDGFDFVNTFRKGRWQESAKGSLIRRLPSNIANNLIAHVSGVKMKDTGSGLKGFKKYLIKNLKWYGEMHRFIPAYVGNITKNITEIPVSYLERQHGESNYSSLTRAFKVLLDLFTVKFMLSFSTKPFTMMPGRIFGSLGLITSGIGFLLTTFLSLDKIIYGRDLANRPLFIIGLIFLVVGLQLLMTGLLGELLMRIYYEASGKKNYVVSEKE